MANGVLTDEEKQKITSKFNKGLEKKELKRQLLLNRLKGQGNVKQAEVLERTAGLKESRARSQVKALKREEYKQSFAGQTGQRVDKVLGKFRTSSKQTAGRARAVRTIAGAIVGNPNQGRPVRQGAGRPSGSYKYGMPIRQFQALQAKQRALARLQAQQQENELLKKGYTQEQIQQFRDQGQIEQQIPQDVQQEIPQENLQQAIEESTVSPNTLAILEQMRRIQNKAKDDDANMQRILRERKMVSRQGELLKAPNIFKAIPGQMEGWLERPETNPLRAPNIFAEDRAKNPSILDTQGRPTILQSVQRLNFFGNSLNNLDSDTQKPKLNFRLNFWKAR